MLVRTRTKQLKALIVIRKRSRAEQGRVGEGRGGVMQDEKSDRGRHGV